VHLAANEWHTCAALRDGSVHCWGAWDEYSSQDARWDSPQRIDGLDRVVKVAVGYRYLCALDSTGAVRCLGSNKFGQLGDGTLKSRDTSLRVPLPRPALDLVAGGFHSCAVLDDRSLWCWGDNHWGQLGDGTNVNRPSPVQTLPPGSVSRATREPR
jgi:alpha-tubulin suppressor-like RCC1 family protein